MKVVIFDLETTMVFSREQKRHLIEIGAVKLNINKIGSMISSSFHEYIKPPSEKISRSTRKFLDITNEDIKNASSIREVIENFISWIGNDYYLCSWANDDRRIFIEECLRNKISLDWLKNYNDIQKPISQLFDDSSRLSLTNALKASGLEFGGNLHNAYHDALNTSKLFLKFNDLFDLQQNDSLENIKSYKCKISDPCKNCGSPVYREMGNKVFPRLCKSCFKEFRTNNEQRIEKDME